MDQIKKDSFTMNMKIKISLLLFFLCSMVFSAQVTVVKSAADINPLVYFGGVAGDTQFSNYVKTSLAKCGWFDLTQNQNEAKYRISGSANGNILTITVSGVSSFTLSMTKESDLKWAAFKMVDAILQKIFNVPGICATKMAFVVQLGKTKEIYTCDFDGSNAVQITNNRDLSLEPSWGVANKLLVYTWYHRSYTDIVGYDFSTRQTHRFAAFPGLNSSASVSPNAKYIAIILSKDKQVGLYIKELQGNRLKKVTNNTAVSYSPTWSPDGRYVCFVSDSYLGRPSLYVYDVISEKTDRLYSEGSEALTPDWSPIMGDRIVYSAKIGGEYLLSVYDIKSRQNTIVNTNIGGSWFKPSWAPDGRHVICSRRSGYKSTLCVVDTWTGKARLLLNSKMDLSSPSWSKLYK